MPIIDCTAKAGSGNSLGNMCMRVSRQSFLDRVGGEKGHRIPNNVHSGGAQAALYMDVYSSQVLCRAGE